MTALSYAVPLAKQAVSARQAADALGLQADRHGRCQCPIHGGKDRNCKLFDGDKGYYCFVCHAGGDVIDLVSHVLNCSLRDAVAWLDSTFRLGLDLGGPSDRRKAAAARRAVAWKREERLRQEEHRRELHRIQLDALSLDMEIDRAIDALRPRRYSEGFSDAFCAVLTARSELHRLMDEIAVMISMAEEKR